MPDYKRRKYLVKRRFQLKYTGIILFFILSTVFLASTITYYTVFPFFSDKLANVYPQNRLISVLSDANLRLLYASLALIILATWWGIILSHRIAGPWHRLETILLDIAGGNISTDIKLRKGDELQSLADAINKVVARLREDETQINQQFGMLKQNLTQIKDEIDKTQPDLARIKELTAKLLRIIS